MEVNSKKLDELYKEWCGKHHTINSNRQVHDSAECIDFAKHCLKYAVREGEMILTLPDSKEVLQEYMETELDGRMLLLNITFPIANHFKTYPEYLKELVIEIVGNILSLIRRTNKNKNSDGIFN